MACAPSEDLDKPGHPLIRLTRMSRLMRKGTLASCGLRSFKHACAATQKDQRCGSLSEASSSPYIVRANSEDSGETARMRRLT